MGVNKNNANKIIIHLLMIAKYKVGFFLRDEITIQDI